MRATLLAVITLVTFSMLDGRAIAQEFDFALRASDDLAGNSVPVTVIVTAVDGGIEGVSLEICHDDILDIGDGDVSLGEAWSDRDFETLEYEFNDESWSVIAVLALDSSDALGEGEDLEIFVASYELVSTGTADLEFCSVPIVTSEGETIDGVGTDGSIESTEPEFLRGDANGDGFVHALIDSRYMLAWALLEGAEPPCMDAADVTNNASVFGLLEANHLLKYAFERDRADLDDPGLEECGVDPEEDFLGCEVPSDPCVAEFELPEADEDYQLWISEETALVDEVVRVSIFLSNEGEPLSALQMSVCHDELVSLGSGDVVRGTAWDDTGWHYTIARVTDDGFIAAALTSVADDDVLDTGDELELYRAFYLVGDETGTAKLEFCDLGERLPVSPQLLTEGIELVVPETSDGSISILGTAIFKRGDVSGDGEVGALVDATALLRWGFTSGDEPVCMDAADVDDNGEVSPLVDSIALLRWAFQQQADPPEPGTEECGEDPSGDELDCGETALGCL